MRSIDQVIEGLQIIANSDPNAGVDAQHDIIYAGYRSELNDADKARLEKLGWHWDDEGNSWAFFT